MARHRHRSLARQRAAVNVPIFGAAITPRVQRQNLEDSDRSQRVHDNLFVAAPGGGGVLQTWQDPQSADLIVRQFKASFPRQPAIRIPVRTTESAAETDAIAMDVRIRNTFSEITTPISESRLRDAVQIMDSSFFNKDAFRRQWLANKMIKHTDIENFNILETDARYHAVQDRLFNDSEVGDDINNTMKMQAAFAEGTTPANREIHMNQGMSAGRRRLTLIHEIIHLYAHPDYRDWIAASTAQRVYNEGLTEFFARQVMSAAEVSGRNSYQPRVDAVNTDIVPFVPATDIRRAFFLGEVWRMEHQSEVARRIFGAEIGLDPTTARNTEVTQSGTSRGIGQQVTNTHFRFLNLAVGGSGPKAEHRTFFQQVKRERLDVNPLLKLKFIGYASGTGPAWLNLRLSRQRAEAFYQMAAAEGIAADRLVDVAPPEHHGESQPTADNDSVIGRAFNRRVEMKFIMN